MMTETARFLLGCVFIGIAIVAGILAERTSGQ